MNRTVAVFLFIFSTFLFLSADPHAAEVRAKKIDETIKIDGLLDEPAWSQSEPIADFVQFEPRYGEPASQSTHLRILYDRKAIYFGIECRDSEPARISAKVTKRDGEVTEDDAVAILIDTLFDKSNAYVFVVNSLGTQQDERWVDNGRTRDSKWDASWKSAGTRNSHGWIAEVAIPFAGIRFNHDSKRWGFDAIRYIPRNLEMSRWSRGLTEWFRISEIGTIEQLNLSDAIRNRFTLIPYIQGQWEQGTTAGGDAGLDVRYNLSSNTTLDVTINPDFATIEADVEEINLTRFELSYPEKRPFFLEGAENYSTRIRQFYSRRIGEIPWGAQWNGKTGRWKYNLLNTQSDPATSDPAITAGKDAIYTAFRIGYDLKNSSNLGLIGANRYYRNQNRGSVGLAGTFFFTDVLGMTAQVLKSYGPYTSGTWAYYFRPSFDSRTSHFHVRYTHVGDRVRENMNEVGFIADDDRREFDTNFLRRFWMKNSFFEEIRPSVNYNQYWSQRGVLRSWDLNPTLDVTFRKKWTFSIQSREEYKLYEKEFRNRVIGPTLKYDNKKGNLYSISYQTGTNYDRHFDRFGAQAGFKLRDGWDFTYELSRVQFRSDLKKESTFIHNLRSTYYFNKDLYLKLFYQSRLFLSGESNSEQNRQTLQCIFVWRILPPFGQVQVAYMQGPTLVTETSDRYRTLFMKLAWVLQR